MLISVKHRATALVTFISAAALSAASAFAATPAQNSDSRMLRPGDMALADAQANTLAMADTPAAEEPSDAAKQVVTKDCDAEKPEEKKLPITIAVSYYLLSDYVYRGINYSEYYSWNSSSGRSEGREKPNNQMTTSINWDFGKYGKLGFDTFFEWYSAQAQLRTLEKGNNLQEVDYIIHWNKFIDPIATDLYLGFQFYEFPHSAVNLRLDRARGNNNDDRTEEWQFKLTHNDAWLWNKLLCTDWKDGVLNPTFFFAQDVGTGAGSVWMEFSLNHPFKIPCVDNLTITPSWTLAMDGGYLLRIAGRPHPGQLRLAYEQWGLNITYDLTPILHLPKWAGTVSVSGLMWYNDALGTAEYDGGRRQGAPGGGIIQDEFYGGMSVNWGWGG